MLLRACAKAGLLFLNYPVQVIAWHWMYWCLLHALYYGCLLLGLASSSHCNYCVVLAKYCNTMY